MFVEGMMRCRGRLCLNELWTDNPFMRSVGIKKKQLYIILPKMPSHVYTTHIDVEFRPQNCYMTIKGL